MEYLFSKNFPLATNYVVDYLAIGKNSGGYEFVFIELESTSGNITTIDGGFGSTIRKGINQINDWNIWLEENYSSISAVFGKSLGEKGQMPKEFFKLDKSRLHFAVIAGRRADFNEKTYTLKRKLLKENNIQIFHYDNLIDGVEFLLRDNISGS